MKSQSWKGLGKVGQGKWACSSCRRKEKTIQSQEDDKLDSLMDIIPSVEQIKNSLWFMSSKYDTLLEEIRQLRKENKELRDEHKTRDCFPALAVRMYNSLPQHLKALESRDFECRLRKWSLANPLYLIKDFFENASNIA
ncbi:hypothetical protein J6590_093830 [Homalodisca vitripennis]|nr:hypothetical protein J6590_093830 [Homalodisca vitripennis]